MKQNPSTSKRQPILRVFKDSEYNKPKSAFDFERSDISQLDQANQSVKDQSKMVLDEKYKLSADVKKTVDEGASLFKKSDNSNSFDIQKLNRDAAKENAKLASQAWKNLFGKK